MSRDSFEGFLAQSFGEGVFSRELRLSKEEAGAVLQKYPKARLKKYAATEGSDGKSWYEIHLPIPGKNQPQEMQTENERLKQELDRLKKKLSDVGMVY